MISSAKIQTAAIIFVISNVFQICTLHILRLCSFISRHPLLCRQNDFAKCVPLNEAHLSFPKKVNYDVLIVVLAVFEISPELLTSVIPCVMIVILRNSKNVYVLHN